MHPRDRTTVSDASWHRPSSFHASCSGHGWSGAPYKWARGQDIGLEVFFSISLGSARSDEWSQDRGRNQGGNWCEEGQQIPGRGRDYGCFGNDWCLCCTCNFGNYFECKGEEEGGALTELIDGDASRLQSIIAGRGSPRWENDPSGATRLSSLDFAAPIRIYTEVKRILRAERILARFGVPVDHITNCGFALSRDCFKILEHGE